MTSLEHAKALAAKLPLNSWQIDVGGIETIQKAMEAYMEQATKGLAEAHTQLLAEHTQLKSDQLLDIHAICDERDTLRKENVTLGESVVSHLAEIAKLKHHDINQFEYGVKSMARNCLPAFDLIDSGKWTTDDAWEWLNAVINNDPKYAEKARQALAKGDSLANLTQEENEALKEPLLDIYKDKCRICGLPFDGTNYSKKCTCGT